MAPNLIFQIKKTKQLFYLVLPYYIPFSINTGQDHKTTGTALSPSSQKHWWSNVFLQHILPNIHWSLERDFFPQFKIENRPFLLKGYTCNHFVLVVFLSNIVLVIGFMLLYKLYSKMCFFFDCLEPRPVSCLFSINKKNLSQHKCQHWRHVFPINRSEPMCHWHKWLCSIDVIEKRNGEISMNQ